MSLTEEVLFPPGEKDDGELSESQMQQLREDGFLLIDGSQGEGGGQVLRISVGLAAVLNRKVCIYKIRHGRSKPGMRAQHLEGIRLVARLHQATLWGANLYSRKLAFVPEGFMPIPGIIADPETAGSMCLLKQVVLPTLLFGNCESVVELRGGTNATMAPQIDYAMEVFRPIVAQMGVQMKIDIRRRGYFPKGGGVLHLSAQPVQKLQPIELVDRGTVEKTYIRSFVARCDRSNAVKMLSVARAKVVEQLGKHPIEEDVVIETECIGTAKGILCVTTTSSGCKLGGSAIANGPKDSPVRLGKFASNELLRSWETSACVDEYLQDQLIIYMTLADGVSRIRAGPLTEHTTTAIQVATAFVGDIFKITPQEDGASIIECQGIGYQNRFADQL